MAKVLLNNTKLTQIMVRGEGTMKDLRKRAFNIKNEAQDVFRAHDRHSDDPYSGDYLDSFYVKREGDSYVVGNDHYTAFWVEFGAKIYPHGNKEADRISVLGYAPLRTAVDIVSSYS